MMLQSPISFDQFRQLAARGNVIPIAEAMLADLSTPVAAFMRLAEKHRMGFLLESVEGREKIARYSFMGFSPRAVLRYHRPELEILENGGSEKKHLDIFTGLQEMRRRYRSALSADELHHLGLPRFTGGFVGFWGYGTVCDLENLPSRHGRNGRAQNAGQEMAGDGFPDAEFGLYDTVLAFDHLRQQILIIANVFINDGELNLRRRYEEALERIELIRKLLAQPIENPPMQSNPPAEPAYTTTRENFKAAVERAKEYIRAGDIFQVVLSQRFQSRLAANPLSVYRALRMINPSPYLYFLKNDPRCLLGSSPEALLRVENGVVEVRPIAGTRRRSDDESEDRRLADELQKDEKERAEHLMLVDLGRNDLGRVCEFSSVEVNEFMIVERYSHVMHLVSNVRGKLRSDLDAIDALRACFPAGTVSGAPKIRAMEIIDELEECRRGPYAGAVGYLDFSGNLDACITIRSIWTENGRAYFQAGAGIVADSDPSREYQETIEKSQAMWNAIDLAERGL
jgi:anthranilate synthase component 1